MAKRRTTKRAKHKIVDFEEQYPDYQCAILGLMGFSTRFIESETKLSSGQVNYRLQRAGVMRRDYRDGESPIAQQTLSSAMHDADRILVSRLKLKHTPA